jgi:diacylglycerol kinase (ATP)
VKTLIVVANPKSGRGRALSKAEGFAAEAARTGFSPIVVSLLGQERMINEIHRIVRERRDEIFGIVTVGGDGLLHTLLPTINEFDIPFTVIPSGTGNDFAREIGAMGKSFHDHLVALENPTHRIDSMKIDGEFGTSRACQVLSLGFDALVNERANRMQKVKGKAKYVVAMIRELPVFKPIHFQLEVDGEEFSREAMLIAIANGPSYGGGMKILPHAAFDDGVLDILIVKKVSIWELIKVFPRVYTGSHIKHPAVEVMKAKHIKVSAQAKAFADGEFIS